MYVLDKMLTQCSFYSTKYAYINTERVRIGTAVDPSHPTNLTHGGARGGLYVS